VADLLGQAPPTPGGLAVALAAIPAVLLADWAYKAFRHREFRLRRAGVRGAQRL